MTRRSARSAAACSGPAPARRSAARWAVDTGRRLVPRSAERQAPSAAPLRRHHPRHHLLITGHLAATAKRRRVTARPPATVNPDPVTVTHPRAMGNRHRATATRRRPTKPNGSARRRRFDLVGEALHEGFLRRFLRRDRGLDKPRRGFDLRNRYHFCRRLTYTKRRARAAGITRCLHHCLGL